MIARGCGPDFSRLSRLSDFDLQTEFGQFTTRLAEAKLRLGAKCYNWMTNWFGEWLQTDAEPSEIW